MADISKIQTIDGTTYNIKDASARNSIPAAATATPKMDGTAAVGSSAKYAKEDHVHPSDTTKWTINNYGQGTTDLSIRPLIAFSRANRLAFLPADQVIIETTTDGGNTWATGGYSDNVKQSLFSTRSASIAIPLLNGTKNSNCGVRITITGMKYNVPSNTSETNKYNYWNSNYVASNERYSNLREMWFWLSANNDSIRVQVYRATGAKPDNWIADFNTDFPLTGWSGSDWVRLSGSNFGGGTTQTGNYWNWRIIFWSRMHNGDTAFRSNTQQTIAGIAGYGDNVWVMPNPLMKEDHLYSWDKDMNAQFPAKVTASSFSGNGASLTDLNGSNISSGTVAADRIAALSASKITSGTFDAARIPNLDASKVSSGTLSSDRLPASGVTAGSYGPSSNVSPTHGGSFSVPNIVTDEKGRITNASTKTITLPTYSTASSSENGLMSATDKSKLDSMTTVPLASGINMTEGTDGLIFTYVN